MVSDTKKSDHCGRKIRFIILIRAFLVNLDRLVLQRRRIERIAVYMPGVPHIKLYQYDPWPLANSTVQDTYSMEAAELKKQVIDDIEVSRALTFGVIGSLVTTASGVLVEFAKPELGDQISVLGASSVVIFGVQNAYFAARANRNQKQVNSLHQQQRQSRTRQRDTL